MLIEFDKSFLKSLEKINNASIKNRIIKLIYEIDNANDVYLLKNIKKMKGFKAYYRIKIGEYRLGFELITHNKLRFLIIAHRKDIYKIFP